MATVKVRSVTANLRDGKLRIPYWDVDTGRGGPCLLVTAALHGNEVQGAEVIRRFRDIAVRDLASGRVLLVPFANLSAVRKRRPHITSEPVASGQSLGVLTSDRDLRTTDIKAPMDGFLWTYGAHRLHCDVALPSQHPYADRGDTLAVIVAPQT